MSWTIVLLLSAGAYAFKATGLLALSRHDVPRAVLDFVTLLPPALLMALVVVQTVGGDGGTVVADARLAGMATAGLAVWRRAPFLVVVAGAAATAAFVRAVA